MAALLKSAESKDFVGSNPTLSATPAAGAAPSAVTAPIATGLCAGCRHARRIETARGSVFWLCRRSETDPPFPRYPALPVLRCAGFEPLERWNRVVRSPSRLTCLNLPEPLRTVHPGWAAVHGPADRSGSAVGLPSRGPRTRVRTYGRRIDRPSSEAPGQTVFGTPRRVPRPILLILVYGIFMVIVGLTAVAQTVLVSADFSATTLNSTVGADAAMVRLFVSSSLSPDDLGASGLTPAAPGRVSMPGLAYLVGPGQILRVEVRLPDGRCWPPTTPRCGGSMRRRSADFATALSGQTATAGIDEVGLSEAVGAGPADEPRRAGVLPAGHRRRGPRRSSASGATPRRSSRPSRASVATSRW